MKATVLQKDLAKVLNSSSRFVSTRAQLPILSNIKLTVKGAKLIVEATNLEISISASIGASVEEEGEIAVPGRTFIDIITNLKAEKVELVNSGETLSISADSFKGKVMGVNAMDFPIVPSKVSNSVSLPKDKFIEAISQTLFSTSPDDTRPALSGILFIFSKENLSLVSSDGFRLSKKTITIKNEEDKKIIIPKNILSELVRIASAENLIQLSTNENEKLVVFGLGDIIVSSRLVEGDYPPFEKIIPASSSILINVSKEDLFSAIKMASVFARESGNIVKLSADEGILTVSAESSKRGSDETKVNIKIEGPAIEISYNYRYLEEFLSVTKGRA